MPGGTGKGVGVRGVLPWLSFSVDSLQSLTFCFLFSFGTLFSTLIVVPPNNVTVLYNLCCLSAKSFSVLLGFVILLFFFLSLLSAMTNELHEVEDEGQLQGFFLL